MTFYDRVYTTAKQRGLSIKKLADNIGISDATIYTWKRTGAPTGKNLNAVAEALGVSVEYLLGNTDSPNSNKLVSDEPLNLYEVSDDERDEVLSINGEPISDEDWAIMKVIMAKYPKKGQ
ncbi:helix-turn-helix domain-containing protein [Weissella tructae]|uniref:helix-turn-helix domain-containing protein n=1 Tax=Weissella tructae TaxID=887702 RepID=UPI003D8EC409